MPYSCMASQLVMVPHSSMCLRIISHWVIGCTSQVYTPDPGRNHRGGGIVPAVLALKEPYKVGVVQQHPGAGFSDRHSPGLYPASEGVFRHRQPLRAGTLHSLVDRHYIRHSYSPCSAEIASIMSIMAFFSASGSSRRSFRESVASAQPSLSAISHSFTPRSFASWRTSSFFCVLKFCTSIMKLLLTQDRQSGIPIYRLMIVLLLSTISLYHRKKRIFISTYNIFFCPSLS